MPNGEFQAFLYLLLPKIKNLSWKKIEGNRRKQKEKKSCLEENGRKQKKMEEEKSCLEENRMNFEGVWKEMEGLCKYFRTIFSYYCFLIPKIQGNIM